ncbi:MAG: DJ-1/PfpI family protein, partial [Bacteroidales bacterium]
MIKNCYIYLFEGFSDWEIAYVTPELNKSEKCQLLYVSKDSHTVCSMGGLKVTTDLLLSEVDFANIDLFILPGGTMWENNMDHEVASFILNLNENNKPIAAICGATAALAKLGALDHVRHTSNALEYLKWSVPAYSAEAYYKNQPAVADQNIIT